MKAATSAFREIKEEIDASQMASDQQFFADHPERRFHIAERWVVRRRGADVFLRAPLPPGPHADDTEAEAERAWWASAWPHLSPRERDAMAKATRRGNRISTRGRR